MCVFVHVCMCSPQNEPEKDTREMEVTFSSELFMHTLNFEHQSSNSNWIHQSEHSVPKQLRKPKSLENVWFPHAHPGPCTRQEVAPFSLGTQIPTSGLSLWVGGPMSYGRDSFKTHTSPHSPTSNSVRIHVGFLSKESRMRAETVESNWVTLEVTLLNSCLNV